MDQKQDKDLYKIEGGFWGNRLKMNAEDAIFYQWDQLEKTHCIDNFRIAAGIKAGFREGFFFSDSDAYKWLDAASRILGTLPSEKLKTIVNAFIEILQKAQEGDGYLYTFNQIHFKGKRWRNLQIGHEFYCLGHLIEAGVSHMQATGESTLFTIAKKAADLLHATFMDASAIYTDGHEEIEIALIRLSRSTGNNAYLELAKRFLTRRGTIPIFGLHFIGHTFRTLKMMKKVTEMRRKYYLSHPGTPEDKLPAHNKHVIPPLTRLRFLASALSGRYMQQHSPLVKHQAPDGHSVRLVYLYTAATMLAHEENDRSLLKHIEKIWDHMVSRRQYVTGGIGSLPLIEGFGRDYELDPEIAYAETCAALGSMLWNHELSLATAHPKYEDLFEWQLYNAASVGMGLDGRTYFYNNPLLCRGEIERAAWYDIPCCPSNLSRMWATLGNSVVTKHKNTLFVNQYFSGHFDDHQGLQFDLSCGIPWTGDVQIKFRLKNPQKLDLRLRIPSWAGKWRLALNGDLIEEGILETDTAQRSAAGTAFSDSRYVAYQAGFNDADLLTLSLTMPIRELIQDKRIAGCGGMVAYARGPLVYCFESVDNPEDFFNAVLDPGTFVVEESQEFTEGTRVLKGRSVSGKEYTLIPYMFWGNRGVSSMTVFSKTEKLD